MLLVILSTALAADPAGFFHPDDVAAASTVMQRASEALSSTFEARSRELARVARALREYRVALDLLGSDAPAGAVERLEALETRYHREQAVLQAFADEVVADFDGEMTAAVQRATASLGELQRCRAEVPTGPAMPGMRQRTKPNPDCEGPNRNARITAAVDADPALAAAVEEIVALEWPTVTLASEAQPPVGTDGAPWVSVLRLARVAVPSALEAIEQADDERRLEVEAALEQPEPDLDALRELVAEIEADTAAARAELGQGVRDLASDRLSRNGIEAVAWCANPDRLGGCRGAEGTEPALDVLRDDKRFQKKASRLSPR